jgi:hypothetical protein
MSSQEYRFERLSAENIHYLVPLFKKVFKKEVTLSFLMAKYNTSYLNISFLGHLAFYEKDPVAFSGFIPARFIWKEVEEIGAQSADSMTLQEHRGKELFTEICRLNEQVLRSNGINFAFGFTNQLSEPVLVNKLGWQCFHRTTAFVIPVKKFRINQILWKLGFGKAKEKKTGDRLKSISVNKIFDNPLGNNENVHLLYNKEYFKYKSFQQNHMIRLNGVIAWIKVGKVLTIGNIEKCAPDIFLETIQRLVELAGTVGAVKLVMQFSENSDQADLLKKIYPAIVGSAIIYKPFNTVIPFGRSVFSYGDIDTF